MDGILERIRKNYASSNHPLARRMNHAALQDPAVARSPYKRFTPFRGSTRKKLVKRNEHWHLSTMPLPTQDPATPQDNSFIILLSWDLTTTTWRNSASLWLDDWAKYGPGSSYPVTWQPALGVSASQQLTEDEIALWQYSQDLAVTKWCGSHALWSVDWI